MCRENHRFRHLHNRAQKYNNLSNFYRDCRNLKKLKRKRRFYLFVHFNIQIRIFPLWHFFFPLIHVNSNDNISNERKRKRKGSESTFKQVATRQLIKKKQPRDCLKVPPPLYKSFLGLLVSRLEKQPFPPLPSGWIGWSI